MEGVEAAAGGLGEGGEAFDGVDVAGGADEVGEEGGLVAGAGAEFEDLHSGVEVEFLGHEGDHIRLGDGLAFGAGEGFVGVGAFLVFVGDEEVAGDFADGFEDAVHDDAAAAELVFDHALAGDGMGIGWGIHRCTGKTYSPARGPGN